MPTLTIAQIVELAGLEPDSNPAKIPGSAQVSRVSAIGDATPDALVSRTADPDRDIVAATALCTATIESWIRRYPDQWLWVHRRWKTRPEGEPKMYN